MRALELELRRVGLWDAVLSECYKTGQTALEYVASVIAEATGRPLPEETEGSSSAGCSVERDDVYIAKCQKACQEILDARGDMPLDRIIVYGSLARGQLGLNSDIDILLVLDTDVKETAKWRASFNKRVPAYFTDEIPYVDVRFVSKGAYDCPSYSEFGDYIRNCRKDGICVWPK